MPYIPLTEECQRAGTRAGTHTSPPATVTPSLHTHVRSRFLRHNALNAHKVKLRHKNLPRDCLLKSTERVSGAQPSPVSSAEWEVVNCFAVPGEKDIEVAVAVAGKANQPIRERRTWKEPAGSLLLKIESNLRPHDWEQLLTPRLLS